MAQGGLPVADAVDVQVVDLHGDGVIDRAEQRLLVDGHELEVGAEVGRRQGEGLGGTEGLVVDQLVDVLEAQHGHLVDEGVVPVGVLKPFDEEVVPLARHDLECLPALRLD